MLEQRHRIRHGQTFTERLIEEAAQFRQAAEQATPGMPRELLLKRAKLAEAAVEMNLLLRPIRDKHPAN